MLFLFLFVLDACVRVVVGFVLGAAPTDTLDAPASNTSAPPPSFRAASLTAPDATPSPENDQLGLAKALPACSVYTATVLHTAIHESESRPQEKTC